MKTGLGRRRCSVELVFSLGFCVISSFAFNLDPYSPVILTPNNVNASPAPRRVSTHFGFSVVFYRENNESWLLIGAPGVNASTRNDEETGYIYKCNLTEGVMRNDTCSLLDLFVNDTRNLEEYKSHSYNQWLGVAMDTSDSENGGKIVGCGHLMKYVFPKYFDCIHGIKCYQAIGICYSRRSLYQNISEIVSRKPREGELLGDLTDHDGKKIDVYRHAFAHWGMSVRLSKEEGHVLMGGPGAYQFQGGVNLYNYKTMVDCTIEKIGTYTYSYLGYSVTDIRLPSRSQNELIIASGAPRYDDSGLVLIFSTSKTGHCSFPTIQNITAAESIFGYFGASILAEDVDGDGDDELFVGAPLQNRTRGDEGAVHCYAYNASKRSFERTLLLTPTNRQGSRFGTAIASIGDMNLDGYKDIVIGAPFEDEGIGAIYIYLGSPSGIIQLYHQRITPSDFPRNFPLKAFGHSISTGRDIDGNSYPDLSVGAYRSDSVVVFRSRPVHNVTATIWFLDSLITWSKPNCTSASNRRHYEASVFVSFNYTIPEQERKSIVEAFVLTNYQNRSAVLDESSRKVIFEDTSDNALQFLIVPCLAGRSEPNCISFRAVDRPEYHLRVVNEVVYLASKVSETDRNYNQETSFMINGSVQHASSFSIEMLSKRSFYLHTASNGTLAVKESNGGLVSSEAVFTFISDKYLPCIEELNYDLKVDQRAFFLNKENQQVNSVKDKIRFTTRHLKEPLTRTWTFILKKYPKAINTPLKFDLYNLAGPIFKADETPKDRNKFVRLSPMLNIFTQTKYETTIGFQKECGDDDRCDAKLDAGMTVVSVGGGLVVGGASDLVLRFLIINSGELANSVRLEITHDPILTYKGLLVENQCNQVVGETFSSPPLSGVNCDVEYALHTNESFVFDMNLDTKAFRTEDDFPNDEMEFFIRTGTEGIILNGTASDSSTIPVRYESKLKILGSSTQGQLELDPEFPANLSIEHSYEVSNVGEGLMPSVTIEVLIPADSSKSVIKTVEIQVRESPSMIQRRNNGTVDSEETLHEETANGTDEVRSIVSKPEEKGFISAVVGMLQGSSQGRQISMDCNTGPCQPVRRYQFGSMPVKESIVIKIKVGISTANLSKIEDLGSFNFETIVRTSPAVVSVNVAQWKAGQRNMSAISAKVNTEIPKKIKPASIPLWIYIVSAVVGLIHLVVILIVLWKCGFFKRKSYERIQEARQSRMGPQSMEVNGEMDEQERGSQYDNDQLLDKHSQRSRSQYSMVESYSNEANDESTKAKSPAVDQFLAQHPGIDFTAE